METITGNLKERWEALKNEMPHLRIKNAAEQLGVTEAELLVTRVGDGVRCLTSDFQAILKAVANLGKVMALTRNNEVVHERKGVYLNPELENPHVGLFVGDDIDLRIFFASWKYAFAVEENGRKSIQFFGKDGIAIHKIFLTEDSDEDAFEQLVNQFLNDEQFNEITVEPTPEKAAEKPDSEIDVEGFQKTWEGLQDTHHFFGMLRKYSVSRTQALRLAPQSDRYAIKVANTACRRILEEASKENAEIMVFVGNPGMIQIHTGPVHKVVEARGWYNVLDPDFNLHILDSAITDTWVVRKPTEDGMVTALECFNADGEQIVQLFGKRKPGIPELALWKTIVERVEKELEIKQ